MRNSTSLSAPLRFIGGALSIPFTYVLLLLALLLGIASGVSGDEIIMLINDGFGEMVGYIALILLPSFVLAEVITQVQYQGTSGRMTSYIAPFAGAAMVCPDTAYAALSPMSAQNKLSVLFGSYAGFKMLVPAGPAIVAAMLGGLSLSLIVWSTIVCLFCWAAGLTYARRFESDLSQQQPGRIPMVIVLPLGILLVLVALGGFLFWQAVAIPAYLSYFLQPPGTLLIAALSSLLFVKPEARTKALEAGLSRTASLLLTIGAASALGIMIARTLPFERLAHALVATNLTIPALFALTAIFKCTKGSSMATFAGTAGIVSALLPLLNISAEAATLALCAGAFVAIAPNDSLYWLVREDAFGKDDGPKATYILAVGSTLQGLTALLIVQLAVWFELL